MSNHTKALEFIKTLVEKFGKGGYIFRGTTTSHSEENEVEILDGINSTLYRWVVREDEKEKSAFDDEEHETLKKIFVENEHFSPATMEKEILAKAREMSQSNANAHEILTDLQHFGGKTNMIDFSHSIYIALFFACQSEFGKCGELIALHKDKLPLEKGKIEIIDPANTKDSHRRASFQESVFVRSADGYINPKLCDIEKISKEYKVPILEYLRKEKGIEPNTVYNDLHGFIKNQKNNETATLYSYMGLTSQKKGDNKKAIDYYGKSIEKNPNVPDAYNNRGNAYHDLGEYDRALESLNKAISLDLGHAEAYNGRGVVHKKLNKYDLAIEDYSRAIALKPSNATAYYNRGNAYEVRKQYKIAVEDYSNAISLDPKDDKAYNNRGVCYARLGEHKRAIKDFDQSILLDPKNPETFFNRGCAYDTLGEYTRSIKDFSVAISIAPNYAKPYNNRGNAYAVLNQNDLAIKDYDKFISIAPNYAGAYQNRGLAKEKIGDAEGAKADFEKAKELGYTEEEQK